MPTEQIADVAWGAVPAVATVARIYNRLLGGKDNYAVDRRAADRLVDIYPEAAYLARANRAQLARVTRYLAQERQLDQFIDLGAGLPVAPYVHEVAHRFQPRARVVYIDNDPIVATHSRAIRDGVDGAVSLLGDLRDPDTILSAPEVRNTIDFERPVGVLAMSVLQFIPDSDYPAECLRAIRARMAPGSVMAFTHVCSHGADRQVLDRISEVYQQTNAPIVFREHAEIASLFAGFHLERYGPISAVGYHDAVPNGRGHTGLVTASPGICGGIGVRTDPGAGVG
jgi:hypothetical protein